MAIVLTALFILSLLCTCACIKFDSPQSAEATPTNAAATEQPSVSEAAETPATAAPDVIPSPDAPAVTPVPFATPSPAATSSAVQTPAPSGGASPTPVATPTATTSAPTPTPTQSQPGVTPAPTPEPVAETGLVWFDDSAPVYYDLDLDGKADKVDIDLIPISSYSYSCVLRVTVGASGKELMNSFTTEYFTKALINNFNSSDGRAEIIICGGTGNKGQTTRAYRLNSDSNGIDSVSVPGWIETVNGNSIEFGRYIDILGTWSCSATFAFAREGFALVQQGTEWHVHRDSDRWCTVSDEFLIELFLNNSNENYASFLYPGDKIYPTATDLSSYIRFTADTGDNGSINITVDGSGNVMINGDPVDNWFSDLQYID